MTFSPLITAVIVLACFLTSIISGILGMGGGVLLIAVLFSFLDPQIAIPLHAAIQTFSNGTRVLLFFKHIRWKIFFIFLAGMIPGSILGIFIFSHLDKNLVKISMGFFILFAVYWPLKKEEQEGSLAIFGPVGFIVGGLGVIFGAVGPLTAPFYLRKNILKEELIATKAMCQLSGHIVKFILFWWVLGVKEVMEAHWVLVVFIAAVVGGTWVGKQILKKVSEDLFKKVLHVLLTLIALRLIGENLWLYFMAWA